MKPNFALSLSFDGIGLLHRAAASQWHVVGEVSPDSADLAANLAALREQAAALEPSGVTTKLIIPDEQIRYLDLAAADSPGADHKAAALAALDGATPYALEDLAFDWNVVGDRLYVAAVARETLAEAESFALEHRFNPLSFVARPRTDAFGTEPFFGETAQAAGQVVRDERPLEIVDATRLPEPPPPAGGAEDPAEPDRGRTGAGQPDRVQDDVAPADSGAPDFAAVWAGRDMPATGAPPLSGVARSIPEKAPDRAARSVGQQDRSGDWRRDGQGAVADPAPAAASLAPRRKAPEEAAVSGGEGTATHMAPVPPAPSVLPEQPPLRRRPSQGSAQRTVQGTSAPVGPARGLDRDTGASEGASEGASQGLSAPAAAGPVAASARAEADRLTIFGARDTSRGRRGKPRFLGLILTALLLLFMAAVAAWAAIFPDSQLARIVRWSEPQIAMTPESPDPILSQGAQQEVLQATPPAPAPGDADIGPVAVIPPGPGDATAADPDATPDQPLRTEVRPDVRPEVRPDALTPDEARGLHAGTDIWHMAPEPPREPDAGTLDDYYLTSIDEDVPMRDAVALAAMPGPRRDTRPATPEAPAPAGTTFTLDARGLVVATPGGALTPDGVLVRAGSPALRPPAMPPRAVPVPGLSLSPEAETELNRVSGIRPRPRPGDLVERQERGALGGRSRSELASLRPRPRTDAVRQAVRQAAEATTPEAAAVDPVPAAAAETTGVSAPDAPAMPEAVTASLKPQTRPGNFQTIVRRQSQPAPQQAPQQRQQAQPQQQQQPATAAPRIPSSASVAQRATERNAINLRQINLIGVYGSQSNRRALVRLPNGRYRQVEVGDRIDGGQVSAIGASELRYTKRGRSLVLRMPQS